MNPYLNSIFNYESEIVDVSNVGETLAYTWFGRPNYAYSEEDRKYWIGSTTETFEGTTQYITEYDIDSDTFTTTKIGTVFQKDDHNQVQILIRNSDKRLIAFYTEHNGLALRYRISMNPLDASEWENEKNLNPHSSYSYVSPYQNSNGDIFIFFRTTPSAAKWYYMKSTDGGNTFGDAILFFSDGNVQAYLITAQNGNRIDFIATNGHPENNPGLNINTYHFYFDLNNETFHSSDGTVLTISLNVSKLTLVNDTSGNDTSWILDISYKNNLPRILYVKYPGGRSNNFLNKELWFIEWDGKAWINNKRIDTTLSGYIEDDENYQEAAYPPASRFDTKDSDIIWMPKQVNSVLEIHKVDVSTNPCYIEQITFNSEVDNWRPISVPSVKNNLLWLKKNRYDMYDDYDISLLAKTVNT